jgi:hypothetical protein
MRRHDWADRLYATVEAFKGTDFEWGENDCCIFVARCVDAMTGSDLVHQLQNIYWDEDGAQAVIGGDLSAAVSAFLGQPSELRAMRGDVVMVDGGDGFALGICLGQEIAGVGPDGLRLLPRGEILKVWKV